MFHHAAECVLWHTAQTYVNWISRDRQMNHFNTSTHNELYLNKALRVECYLTKTKRAKTSGLIHFYALSLCFNVIICVTAVCLSVFVKHFKLRQVRSLVRGCEIWFLLPSASRTGVCHHVHTESFCILHANSLQESSRDCSASLHMAMSCGSLGV